MPGRDEVDVHEVMGHAQYRAWCEDCVYGQGREDLHLRGEKWRSLPVVSYDYAFLSEHDMKNVKDKKREFKEAKEATKLLIGKGLKVQYIVCTWDSVQGRSQHLMEL